MPDGGPDPARAVADATRIVAGVAGRLRTVLQRGRPGVGSWERGLMMARYAIPQLPSGPRRADALDAYLALTRAGPGLVATAAHPDRARRQIAEALICEARMLRTEALGPGERRLAMQANTCALQAVAPDAHTQAGRP